ncbi:MAG: ATP-binding protein, partial [Cyclobacteriaceae bacterium]
AVIQIRSLDEEEQRAKAGYEKQMEIMLFTLNNLADDMMRLWMRRLSDDQKPVETNAADLTLGNESIQLLTLRDLSSGNTTFFPSDYVSVLPETKEAIKHWYTEKDSVLTRLDEYMEAGFQKIHAVEDWPQIEGLEPGQAAITAMLYDRDSTMYNALLVIEPTYWIEQILGTSIQDMDSDGYVVAVLSPEHDGVKIDFSYGDFDTNKDFVKKEIWVLSDSYLAIQPKGESYYKTIEKRSQNTVYYLLFSLFIFLFGAVIIIRNIRNAFKIAQLKSDFVSNVSHEIRTPLSLIRMYAETLKLGRITDDEKKKHYYNIIHHESGRLTYLVNNILDFSRIEANQKTYHFEEGDLNELVQSLCRDFSFYFEEKKVDFKLALSKSKLPISMDALALEEAISNLIENAIKYGGEEKHLLVKTYIKNDHIFLEIADQGIGIPPESQGQIFDKFYRVENALTQKTKGTGLGLSLVKHIVQAHGGKITVSSKLGEGSTFTIKFPIF